MNASRKSNHQYSHGNSYFHRRVDEALTQAQFDHIGWVEISQIRLKLDWAQLAHTTAMAHVEAQA